MEYKRRKYNPRSVLGCQVSKNDGNYKTNKFLKFAKTL